MIRRLNLELFKFCNRKLQTSFQLSARAENRCFVATSSSTSNFHDRELYSLNKKIAHFARIGRINDARALFDKMEQRNTVTWNSMMTCYVNRREISNARKLFDEMPERDVVSWNLMISGYVSCRGKKFIEEGRHLFDKMPERNSISWNTIINGYAKNGLMEEALQLFNAMPDRNSISCNAIVTGFLHNGNVIRAIEFFESMPGRDVSSLNALVSGLIQNGELDKSARILLQYRKNNSEEGKGLLLAYNTLIAGFGQRGRVSEARSLFDQIPFYSEKGRERFERNVMTWNTMIMCFVKAGDIVSGRELFDQMTERDTFSWNTMINGYIVTSNMAEAMNLFFEMPNPDTVTWNSMISGSAQKGNMELSHNFFRRMPYKNLISWNSIIAGYEKNEDYKKAIELFVMMQMEGEKPDQHTLSSLLGISSGLADVRLGMQIHQLIIKTVIPDVPLNNAIITMYSKCGAIAEARLTFDDMKMNKQVRSWNAMIGGYASNGYGIEALELFKSMTNFNVQPTYVTYISVLNACANVGLVDEACRVFRSMVGNGIEPGIEHFASLVDNLGRHGQLKEALDLVNSMPIEPDVTVWGALLSASRVHNNLEMAQIAAEAMMRIEPDSSVPYVLLYNMYVDVGQWENASKIRAMMERNNIKKEAALSWVDSS